MKKKISKGGVAGKERKVKAKEKASYTMMLLMGMWTNFTKNPTKPIRRKPTPTAWQILRYSNRKKRGKRRQRNEQKKMKEDCPIPLLSGLVHLLMKRMLSRQN